MTGWRYETIDNVSKAAGLSFIGRGSPRSRAHKLGVLRRSDHLVAIWPLDQAVGLVFHLRRIGLARSASRIGARVTLSGTTDRVRIFLQ